MDLCQLCQNIQNMQILCGLNWYATENWCSLMFSVTNTVLCLWSAKYQCNNIIAEWIINTLLLIVISWFYFFWSALIFLNLIKDLRSAFLWKMITFVSAFLIIVSFATAPRTESTLSSGSVLQAWHLTSDGLEWKWNWVDGPVSATDTVQGPAADPKASIHIWMYLSTCSGHHLTVCVLNCSHAVISTTAAAPKSSNLGIKPCCHAQRYHSHVTLQCNRAQQGFWSLL